AYWRQTTLDTYSDANGGSWVLNAEGNNAVGAGLSGPVPAQTLHQTYAVGPLGERWMPAAFEPVAVNQSGVLVVRSSSTLVTSRSSIDGLRYTVESRLPDLAPNAAQRAATAAPVPASLRPYLGVPAGVTADVRAAEQQVVRGTTNPYDRAAALRDFFRGGAFTYDQNVQLGDDAGAMSRFLQSRRGFCVQFAATYAVMARLAGIPARLAVGFTPGTPDAHGVYHVTNYEAHAWPEVWLAGIGWTNQFEPTPAGSAPGASNLPQDMASAGAPPARAAPVPTTTPATTPAAPGGSNGTGSGTGSPSAPSGRGATVTRPSSGGGNSTLGGVLFLVALAATGIGVVAALALVRKRRRRRQRRAGSDPAALINGAWAEVLDELRDAGVGWPVSLTPLELAAGLRGRLDPTIPPPFSSLAHRYTAARYGDGEPGPESGEAAWRDAEAVVRALERSLDLRARLRAQFATRPTGQPDPAGWSLPRRRSTKV
ncbi:MAG TPA: transglutaminase domain-containing protein, partial [Acidimicrobiia bacterium]|nr:transglutaminase domain-containing protein [Acidimicrobiia bacterium]